MLNEQASNKKSYSVAEIRQILDISRPIAYGLIKKNEFESIRVGSSIRIIKVSFDTWLDSQI